MPAYLFVVANNRMPDAELILFEDADVRDGKRIYLETLIFGFKMLGLIQVEMLC